MVKFNKTGWFKSRHGALCKPGQRQLAFLNLRTYAQATGGQRKGLGPPTLPDTVWDEPPDRAEARPGAQADYSKQSKQASRFSNSLMILPQVHLRKPCYDFYFL